MKQYFKIISLLSIIGICSITPATATYASQNLELRVEELLSKMTLQEKIGQTAMRDVAGWENSENSDRIRNAVQNGQIGAFLNIDDPETVDELQHIAVEHSRLGIPLLISRDVIHGYKTIFPIPLGIASTWEPEDARIVARISAFEAVAKGVRWTFAPMMDISRDPRWGRIAESFGEDPYLASEFSVAMVTGFQTDDLSNPDAIAACAKHFVGYGAAVGGRDYNTALIPERTLRDIYLKPFKASTDAGCATLMSAFNDLNGIPASGNKRLLKKVLRDEWNWDGMVVSDWESVTEMIEHGYAANEEQAAALGFNAGVNMEMISRSYDEYLFELIEEGIVSEAWLDEMVRQILRLKFRLGLFDSPYRIEKNRNRWLLPDSLDKAKKVASDSIILLKNEQQTLPLMQTGKSYAIIGPMADAPHEQMGTWCFDGDDVDSVTPLAAIRHMVGQENVNYAAGLTYSRDRSHGGFDEAISIAEKSDVILFFAGEEAILSGEAHCRSNLDLPGAQNELLERLSLLGKPLVLIVMSGRPNTIQKQIQESDSVLVAFHGGTMAGPALADVLFGKVSPSGRLPVTWPVVVGQIPIYYNHKNTGRSSNNEDFVPIDEIPLNAPQTSLGNTSHYLDIGYKPAFPFGYGLTYTSFKYSDLQLSSNTIPMNGNLTVSAIIENTGEYLATEVVQLYVRDLVGDVTRPVRELKGFQRVELSPGEKRRVSFEIYPKDLSFYNSEMKEVTERGQFNLWIAPNAAEGLQAEFWIK